MEVHKTNGVDVGVDVWVGVVLGDRPGVSVFVFVTVGVGVSVGLGHGTNLTQFVWQDWNTYPDGQV